MIIVIWKIFLALLTLLWDDEPLEQHWESISQNHDTLREEKKKK